MWATSTPRPHAGAGSRLRSARSAYRGAAWFALAAAPFFVGMVRPPDGFPHPGLFARRPRRIRIALYPTGRRRRNAQLAVAATLSYAAVLVRLVVRAQDRIFEDRAAKPCGSRFVGRHAGRWPHRMAGVCRRVPGTRWMALAMGSSNWDCAPSFCSSAARHTQVRSGGA